MNKMYDASDIALVIYATYKGLKNREIATLFGVSAPSIDQIKYTIAHPEGRLRMSKIVAKGSLLEAKVRSGLYPDQRKLWDTKIGRITNVNYTYKEPEPVVEEKKEEVQPVVEKKYDTTNETLFTFSVNTDLVSRIFSMWKGTTHER